jgi:hypothetical protein
LQKREPEFSTFDELKVLVVSWNIDAQRPDTMATLPDSATVLEDAVRDAGDPDIIVFGFQEVVDLESRKVAAKVIVLKEPKSGAKVQDNQISERVTGAYRRWHDKLTSVVWQSSAAGQGYTLVGTEHLVGLFSAVFVKISHMPRVTDTHIKAIKTGMGGRYGNKVRQSSRFRLQMLTSLN